MSSVSVELESFKDGGAKLRSCLDSDVGAELGSWLDLDVGV